MNIWNSKYINMEKTANHQLGELHNGLPQSLAEKHNANESSYTSARLQWKEFVGSRHSKIEEAALMKLHQRFHHDTEFEVQNQQNKFIRRETSGKRNQNQILAISSISKLKNFKQNENQLSISESRYSSINDESIALTSRNFQKNSRKLNPIGNNISINNQSFTENINSYITPKHARGDISLPASIRNK